MAEYELVVNYDKCIGCCICETICSMHHGQGANPRKSMINIVKLKREAAIISLPIVCMQCEKPMCKAVCPTGSISSHPTTGAKIIDKKKCIGCSVCVYACPFGAILIDRSIGYALVCNLCDGNPLCVKFCPFGVLQYIKRDEVSIRLKRARADKLLESHNLSSNNSE